MASADDSITWTLTRAFGDKITVDEHISKTPIYRPSDIASIDDIIKYTLTKMFGDSISTSGDSITPFGSIKTQQNTE